MKGALTGLTALIVLLFIANCVSMWILGAADAEFNFLTKYYAVFYASMLFVLSLYIELMGVLLMVKVMV